MKKKETYPIILNHLTMWEHAMHVDTFEEYTKTVTLMLQIKDIFFYEDEIIAIIKQEQGYKDKEVTMEMILREMPHKYLYLGLKRKDKNEEFKKAYVDIGLQLEITPEFPYYDVLFAYQLRNTALLDIDGFLNYTLEKYNDNEVTLFKRFVQLTLRKYGKNLLNEDTILTVNEWLAAKELSLPETVTAAETPDKKRTKGIPKREAGDNLTKLNQEQTALLFAYLQKGHLILKDEYLNNTQAGEAISILTGYSSHTLRQKFGKTELERIAKENKTEFYNCMLTFIRLIKSDLGIKGEL